MAANKHLLVASLLALTSSLWLMIFCTYATAFGGFFFSTALIDNHFPVVQFC